MRGGAFLFTNVIDTHGRKYESRSWLEHTPHHRGFMRLRSLCFQTANGALRCAQPGERSALSEPDAPVGIGLASPLPFLAATGDREHLSLA
jgi:hypothetical protein